ncbi:PaaI family thioesterase [Salinadaptatus halalkaliphilus]|uniref:PaaI family thioesterase n=1 Tax=Salinadaptatus halalkaliphilus TaxID=2419781 RepID=A0A4S3TH83_9EURY|nr:PaaI family thioesterase [Salinadaptatus halalkaliphilus]THE63232.1 PaaI family thioesterase [Salinadaptatus halalkaliphilus]
MSDSDADGEDDEPQSRAGDSFPEGTFNSWLGLTIEEECGGEAVISVEYEDFKQNPGGILHGGVTATLVDVAAAVAIRSTLDDQHRTLATTNLEINYLRPITETAYASAEVIRVGSSTAVVRVDVESLTPDADRTDAAIGTVTYRLL